MIDKRESPEPHFHRPETTGDALLDSTSRENIEPAILRRLALRRDGPARTRAIAQVGAFALSVWATLKLAAASHGGAWLAVTLCALMIMGFFAMLHESGHRTAFASKNWNVACNVWGAIFMLQAPSFFREFHRAHHRWTQDRELDPEIAYAPDQMDGWPKNPIVYLALASGQFLMLGKFAFTVACALLPESIWVRLFPFVREDRRRRIAWESRLVLGLIVGGLWLGLEAVPGFAFLLLAWPLAHVGLGLYLSAEHTGRSNHGSQFERTRSLNSIAPLRWLMWNMPYHSEHHAFPGIPFHALPQLRQHFRQHCPPHSIHALPGYLAFHRESIRQSLTR
jgi:fatty acid desaturase